MKNLSHLACPAVPPGPFHLVPARAAEEPDFLGVCTDNREFGEIAPLGATLPRTPHLHRMAREEREPTCFCFTAGACTPPDPLHPAGRGRVERSAKKGTCRSVSNRAFREGLAVFCRRCGGVCRKRNQRRTAFSGQIASLSK